MTDLNMQKNAVSSMRKQQSVRQLPHRIVLEAMNQRLWTQQDLALKAGLEKTVVQEFLIGRLTEDPGTLARLEGALQLPQGLLQEHKQVA